MADSMDVVTYRQRDFGWEGPAYAIVGLFFALLPLFLLLLHDYLAIDGLARITRAEVENLGERIILLFVQHGLMAPLFLAFSGFHFYRNWPARNLLQLDPRTFTITWAGEEFPLLWREISGLAVQSAVRTTRIEFAVVRHGLLMRSAPWFERATRHGAIGKIEDRYDVSLPETAAQLYAFHEKARAAQDR